jgi:glutathione S-transferase
LNTGSHANHFFVTRNRRRGARPFRAERRGQRPEPEIGLILRNAPSSLAAREKQLAPFPGGVARTAPLEIRAAVACGRDGDGMEIMRLYVNGMSPYGRKVRIVIHELGLSDRVERVDTFPRDRPEEAIARGPLGKIPVLETDDGRLVRDSAVIVEYLDHEYGGNRLLASGGAGRWTALTRMADADGAIESTILVRNERLRPAEQQSPAWIDWHVGKVRRCLGEFDALADKLADRVDIGVIAVGCAANYVPTRLPEFEGLTDFPRLAALCAELRKRPSFAATEPR